MAAPVTLKIKRKLTAGAPTTLQNGELVFNESNDLLYYGKGSGGVGGSASQIIPIAGDYSNLVTLNTNQTLTGLKTFNQAPILQQPLTISSGGTGANNAAQALINLGAASQLNLNNHISNPNIHIDHSSITISPGVGLTGGGDLTATRTLTLGTPSTLTASTTNSATGTTHTHAITGFVPTTRTISPGVGLTGGGNLTTNRTLALTNTPVTPGTYTLGNFTVDAQGRLTAASSTYEEGTWTPNLIGLTTAGSITWAIQTGSYTRIGSQITVTFTLNVGAITTQPTGIINLTGLPFTSRNLTNTAWQGSVRFRLGDLTEGGVIRLAGNSTTALLSGITPPSPNLTFSGNLINNDFITGTLTYFI